MKRISIIFITAWITACATQLYGRADLLDFIKDGQTTREETYLHLGEPSALFDDERIMSFRLGRDEAGYFLMEKASGFVSVKTSLMMVFDEQGVLKRHTLVQIKVP